MDYSIIIPVFNKAELTRNCLSKLRPSLEGAGEGEVIVIDNASTDHTPHMLREFPWIRLIRNERNLGFAGANNQGAREARGELLVLLNNDTEPLTKWLAPMLRVLRQPGVGAVGARLLYPNGTIQHAGVVVSASPASAASFVPHHYAMHRPGNIPEVERARDFQIVTGACMATPRDLYLELGGLDEGYWNGYEDVDYCLKVRERGLRVVYEPSAVLVHYESQSGAQRFRRAIANIQRLAEHWKENVRHDEALVDAQDGRYQSVIRAMNGTYSGALRRTEPIDVIVHGRLAAERRAAFATMLAQNRSPIGEILWADGVDAVARARTAMELRGEHLIAFVRSDCVLEPGWLDELVAYAGVRANACAATFDPRAGNRGYIPLLTADARCVLLRLRMFPQHVELGDFATLDEAVADLLLRAADLDRVTLGVTPRGTLGSAVREPDTDEIAAIEARRRARPHRERGLVSIVTLSWNAHQFTIKALESIRANTSEPYEVIVVDNGSGPETLEALGAIDDPHVRIVYNATNRGFAGGNNDGIAEAKGEHVIVLNNDVVVTPGWVDGLLDAFRRIPDVGISAPRSNKITGHQQLPDVLYHDENDLIDFARKRSADFAQKGYIAERAIGFCWCIPRTVIEQVGGLDESYGAGNFEDDDYCMRVKAAGYGIYVCDDVFIHHFGSQTFVANKIDYRASMEANWEIFARKWGFSGPIPYEKGYVGAEAHARGFRRAEHYVPLPPPRESAVPVPQAGAEPTTFTALVRSEADWSAVAQFVRRFGAAFRVADPVRLLVGSFGMPDAQLIATRVERILEKAGTTPEASALIEIVDYESEDEYASERRTAAWIDVASIDDRSPSALRRLVGSDR